MNAKKYLVDPQRRHPDTGIKVRAYLGDVIGNWDIADLERESLLKFLRSRGGENTWAENTVLILLGHKCSAPPFRVND
jgi:hypothetical protein